MYMRLLVLIVTLTTSSLWADSLTYTTSEVGGKTSYQFTLTNTGTTGGTLFDLFLHLPTDIGNIDTGTIGTPVGWGDPAGGLLFFGPDVSPSTSFIEWTSDFSGLYDVGIGSSLSGYSFTATDIVGPITFALNGSTEFAPAQGVTPVPEPAMLIPLLASLVAISILLRFKSAAMPR
jgi:hypothetical protein